ncbi:Tripartite motif-containing protein 2/3 [Paragonimus skrjabini miyazakii]|uniref:Tripartite motif-containing protein 2/3 n=1 Tax=Paragonimus skrjabini miyazakii TaxID=59628 RepID=A0A8S9YXR8_9TREM|nr:Tripartite motif-containing protein 2/3 [Paragonimus skrjabini miyazakii]
MLGNFVKGNVTIPINCRLITRKCLFSTPIQKNKETARRASVFIQHPLSSDYILAVFYAKCGAYYSDSRAMHIGKYSLSELQSANSTVLPTLCISLEYIEVGTELFPGPLGPVLLFKADISGRIYLIAKWRLKALDGVKPDNHVNLLPDSQPPAPTDYFLICLQAGWCDRSVDSTQNPVLLWSYPIGSLVTPEDARMDLSVREKQINWYRFDRADFTRLVHCQLIPDASWSSCSTRNQFIHNPYCPEDYRTCWFHCIQRWLADDLVLAYRTTCGALRLCMLRVPVIDDSRMEVPYPLYAFNLSPAVNEQSIVVPLLLASSSSASYLFCWDRTCFGFVFALDTIRLESLPIIRDSDTSMKPRRKPSNPTKISMPSSCTDIFVELLQSALSLNSNLNPPIRTDDSFTQTCSGTRLDTLPIRTTTHVYVSLQEQYQHLMRSANQHYGTAYLRQMYRNIAHTIHQWINLGQKNPPALQFASVCDSVMRSPDSGLSINDFKPSPDILQPQSLTDHVCDENKTHLLQGIPRIASLQCGFFGGFGTTTSEFREPNAIAILPGGVIAVADGNAESIKFFSLTGRPLYSWKVTSDRSNTAYPNCLAVRTNSALSPATHPPWAQHTLDNSSRSKSPDPQMHWTSITKEWNSVEVHAWLVVVLRKPCPAVQIYAVAGKRLREFAYDLVSPKGVAVDRDGRIIVVESHIMRITIYSWHGAPLNRFHMQLDFPTSVAVDSNYRIYITDNLGHRVALYNYAGESLGHMGARGLTNYPVGVVVFPPPSTNCVQSMQELVVVVDNHNRLNVTVFRPTGHLIYAMHSVTKHAQTYAIAIDITVEDNASVDFDMFTSQTRRNCRKNGITVNLFLASKDYHVYRYSLPGFLIF